MKEIRLEGLNPVVSGRITPFIEDMLREYSASIHSIHIVGSAVTPDFNEKTSNVNSVIILHKINFDFIRFLTSLGKKYSKKGIAAPLIMTLEYVYDSLDVFPVEFHDFRLIHRTVFGEDIFGGLVIERGYLRLQCEREIKVRLIGLRQSYISSFGEKDRLANILSQFIVGCMPIIRAIIYLLGKEPPAKRHDAVKTFNELTSIEAGVLEKLLLLRSNAIKPSLKELHQMFEQFYAVLESTGKVVDEIRY